MYKIGIYSNDKTFLCKIENLICSTLDNFFATYSVNTFKTDFDLKAKILDKINMFDILIIDVNSKSLSLIELMIFLRKQGMTSQIIYVSDSTSLAYNSIKTKVLAYILKDNLEKELPRLLMCDYNQNYTKKYIPLKHGSILKKVKLSNILYIETFNRGSNIFLKGEEPIYVSIKLSDLIERLPQNIFFRSHFSFIVNASKIVGIKRYEAILDDGLTVPVSKTKYDLIKKFFIDYLSV